MPRRKRAVLSGLPHHVTARGNFRQQVFFSEQDYSLYLRLLSTFLTRHHATLHGYCLMPNHVHLVVTPRDPAQFAKAMQHIQSDYARWQNLRQHRTGHLWQARYDSVALDELHFGRCLCYVEQNPVRARLTTDPAAWPWSSARQHCSGQQPEAAEPAPLDLTEWRKRWSPAEWTEVLAVGIHEAGWQARIRQATLTGIPLGDPPFIEQLEREHSIRLRPRLRGRPPKIPATEQTQLRLPASAG